MKQEEPRHHRSTPQTPEHSPPPPARAEQPLTRPMALGAKFGCWGNVVGGRGRNSHRTSLGRRSHHLFAWALDDPQSTRSATRRGCTKPCPLSYLKCDSPQDHLDLTARGSRGPRTRGGLPLSTELCRELRSTRNLAKI